MEFLATIFAPVQLLAWASTVLYIISFQKQSSDKTIMLWAPADFLIAIHFYFMNAPLLMLIGLGAMVRSFVAIKYSQKTLGVFLVCYLIAIFIALFLLDTGLKDYMAVGATSCFCMSVFLKKSFVWHRTFAFANQACWTTAFILLGSWGGLAWGGAMFMSNLIGTMRYLRDQKSNLS